MATRSDADQVDVGLGWDDGTRPSEGGGSGPLLERAEMASLLGGTRDGARAGVLALVGGSTVRRQRLPMLEVVFERLQRLLSASLRDLAAGRVELVLERITARRFGEHLESLPRPVPIAVVRAVEWDGSFLVTLDRPLAFAVVDVALGGRRSAAPLAIEARPFTSIELALLERFVRLVSADLAQAFAPIAEIRFALERIETDPRFVAVSRPTEVCALLRLGVALDGRGGGLDLLFPFGTLEPVRDRLAQSFPGERFGHDPIWQRHLAGRVREATVELEAVLEEPALTLRRLLELRPGSVLGLSARPDAPVVLCCNGVPMFKGKLGRVDDRVSVRVEEWLGRERES